MKYLVRGAESPERIALLLKFTRITSEPQIDAITDYLCKGRPLDISAGSNGIKESNLNRALSKLDEKTGIHEALKDLEGVGFKSVK